jgi:hypothetical protein
MIRFTDAWRLILGRPLRLLSSLILGALFQILCVFYISFLAAEIGIDLSIADWCWIFGLVSVAVLLPVSIGGIGLREGAFAGFLSLFNVPLDKALALSLAVFSVSLIAVLVGGLLELFRGFKSLNRTQ